jgi:(2R)-3-sulfolactate dehydrogenase (NADP+)
MLDDTGLRLAIEPAMTRPKTASPLPASPTAMFGTNPIAAIFPCRDGPPLSIDMSLSEVGGGKLMVAAD